MNFTRRNLFRSGAAVGGAAATGTLPALAAAAGTSIRRRGTTLARVIGKGAAGVGGYRLLVRGPGESHVVRTDLGISAEPMRKRRRKGLLAFAQLSDVHIVDVQSPLRLEFLDRFDDPSPLPTTGIFTSAYRPQEMLSGQIADAMVQQLNKIARGPVTGKPLALAIQTGDNSDNSQRNEVRWNIDLLSGGTVQVDSGDRTTFEGVCDDDPTYYDRAYWHPHGPPAGKQPDVPMTRYGLPRVPGLLDAARRPFAARGLAMPWYSAFGNHDGLAQGNFPYTFQLSAIATGPLKLISPPAGLSPAELLAELRGDLLAFLQSLSLTPAVRRVTADPDRRLLTRAQIVSEHFTTAGAPVGHGFTAANRRDGTAYYSFDRGALRFVVLDTVNPNGYANGSIDQTQFAWLERLLDRSADRIVMVFSHHTSDTMDNPFVATGGDLEPRVLGPEVLALLLAHPQVVAWVNGHTHKNAIHARKRPGGGLWEINTAAHIDWPQQSRLLEVVDNRDGTISIFTTIVDHAGPTSYAGRLDDPAHLAALAREIAANDWHNRSDSGLGTRKDRNTELLVRMPAALRRPRRRRR
ncbi:MAG: TIGR03767 family metallophosphoesterase [Nocardioides sp.]